MSIFKRRGPFAPSPEHASQGAESARKHDVKLEVFNVRGRAFLAPTSGGPCCLRRLLRGPSADMSQCAAHSTALAPCYFCISAPPPKASADAPCLLCSDQGFMAESREAVQAAISSNDARARSNNTRSPSLASRAQSVSPKAQHGKLQSSLAASSLIAEEELSAHFRNNLLQKCLKPGRSSAQIQRALNAWESRVLEVLHLLIHPVLWKLLHRWRRRGWSLQAFHSMRDGSHLETLRRALKRLRSHARVETLRPFLDEQRLKRRFADWCATILVLSRVEGTSLLFPFRQVHSRCLPQLPPCAVSLPTPVSQRPGHASTRSRRGSTKHASSRLTCSVSPCSGSASP